MSIEQDLSAGSYSHGGEAWVKAVHGTGAGSILCDVEYVESTAGNIIRTKKAVPLYRLTVKSCPWHKVQRQNQVHESTRQQSTRQHQQLTILLTTPPAGTKPDKPLKTILSVACQSGMSKGWRAQEMGFLTSAGKQSNKFWECFCVDLAELNGFLPAVPKARMHREHDSKDGNEK